MCGYWLGSTSLNLIWVLETNQILQNAQKFALIEGFHTQTKSNRLLLLAT
jgi:hypothetical protein